MDYTETLRALRANIDAHFDIRRKYDITEATLNQSFTKLVNLLGHNTEPFGISVEVDGVVLLNEPRQRHIFISFVEMRHLLKNIH